MNDKKIKSLTTKLCEGYILWRKEDFSEETSSARREVIANWMMKAMDALSYLGYDVVKVKNNNIKLFILEQKIYKDNALFKNTIICRANNELEARKIAQDSENKHRCGELDWSVSGANCKELLISGKKGMIACS